MFDYSNLSPSEFEKLCADILSRELGIDLRYFSPGRDGGVDLTDSPSKKNIVVQVKHYSSPYSNLRTSLIKELDKLKEMTPKPQKYYICTSKELTSDNIEEIYGLFSNYMESDKNIFTKNELDKFLSKEENKDILRKNFKLWLVADQVLTQLINRDVFIDGEVLLDDLEEDFKYFVQTNIFNQSISILEKERKLLICGDPGVGKSINSKMLAFYFVKKGYQIRYSTNGLISDLKKSLQDNKELKEVLFLDDCLGQYYLKLRDFQDKELISLMKYIEMSENKILILNSRITVLNEAQAQSRQLKQYLEDDKVHIQKINMNDITPEERALIFYNHLLRNKVPNEYYNSIRGGKKYREIVSHINYNPRIIEYVTHRQRYLRIDVQEYCSYIINMLDNPTEAWAEEFKEGLGIEDRIFMHTLFSLTDTTININILEECFVNRIKGEAHIDHTTNKFEEAKIRLTSSLVKVIDDRNEIKIGVLNPSINDYMKNSISINLVEKQNIVHNAIFIEQIEKVLGEQAKNTINELLINGNFLYKKSIDGKMAVYILDAISNQKIKLPQYRKFILEGFSLIKKGTIIFEKTINKKATLNKLLKDKELYMFYELDTLLDDIKFADSIAVNCELEDLTDILLEFKKKDLDSKEVFYSLLEEYSSKAEDYLNSYDLFEYIEDLLDDVVDIYISSMHKNDFTEYEKAIVDLENDIRQIISEEVFVLMIPLSDYGVEEAIRKDVLKVVNAKIEEELADILEWRINPEPDDDIEFDRDFDDYSSGGYDLDLILDRDIGE